MKKFKKIIALGLAAMAAISAMSISVFASTDNIGKNGITTYNHPVYGEIEWDLSLPEPVEISYDEIVQQIKEDNNSSRAITETDIPCMIPKNKTGNEGNVVGYFTADETSVSFAVKSNGGGKTYNVQLYRDNGSGKKPTLVGAYETHRFGSGYSQSGLTKNKDYYFVISSDDVPDDGANGTYTLRTY